MIKTSLLVAATALSASSAAAQNASAPGPQFQLEATFNDTTTAATTRLEKPILIRKPTLAELDAADPSRPEEFGLAFNCAVTHDGTLDDCRLLYEAPDRTGANALMQTLAPRISISRESAATAKKNAYRLTISASRAVMIGYGMPRTCLPPFCMVEGVRPPPPPPEARDPALRDALTRARSCFDQAWEEEGKLRSAAEKAQADMKSAASTNRARAVALDYVHSRQAVMACITGLDRAAARLPLDAGDAKLASAESQGMRYNYYGQTKFEMAILIGLLDREAARTETSYGYPQVAP